MSSKKSSVRKSRISGKSSETKSTAVGKTGTSTKSEEPVEASKTTPAYGSPTKIENAPLDTRMILMLAKLITVVNKLELRLRMVEEWTIRDLQKPKSKRKRTSRP